QVIPTSTPGPGVLTQDVRRLLRAIAPSGSGLGSGANALVMSRRARDTLIADALTKNMEPDFRPAANGDARYYFMGVPVYCAPVREDENPTVGTVPSYVSGAPFDGTSIYALRLGGPTGGRVLHIGGESANYGLTTEEVNASK